MRVVVVCSMVCVWAWVSVRVRMRVAFWGPHAGKNTRRRAAGAPVLWLCYYLGLEHLPLQLHGACTAMGTQAVGAGVSGKTRTVDGGWG